MNKKASPKTCSRYVAIQALYNSNYQNDYERIKSYFLNASEFKLEFDFKISSQRYRLNKNFLETLLVTFDEEKNTGRRRVGSDRTQPDSGTRKTAGLGNCRDLPQGS